MNNTQRGFLFFSVLLLVPFAMSVYFGKVDTTLCLICAGAWITAFAPIYNEQYE